MEKVLLAVDFRQLEEFIKKSLKNEFMFVGVTTYRDGVIRQMGQTMPDIVVIRETLQGNENIMDIIYEIRTKFHNVRIIFLAKKRVPGDALLATLVSYGVYDILYGEKILSQEIIRLIRQPNGYKDVQHLQPKPVLDERKNKVLFEKPDVHTIEKEIVKEVLKEVYIDTGAETRVQQANQQILQESSSEIKSVETNSFESEDTQKTAPELRSPKPSSDATSAESETFEDQTNQKTNGESTSTESSQPKEKIRLLNKLLGGKSGDIRVNDDSLPSDKQKIITFMGSKAGVGNTSLALNTAIQLSQKKKRVIYIEMNDRTPAVNYWYEMGMVNDGIDSALKAFDENQFEKIKEAIICSADLVVKESALQKNYKKFPNTLDFMFFSNRYLTRRSADGEELDLSLTKELYLYLMFQLEYDFIILDVPSNLENPATLNALLYSNTTVITTSQDVSAIGNAVYMLNEMRKSGFQLSKNIQFIVNRFEKADLSMKEIAEWVQVDEVLTVPCFNKDFINANFVGLPVILYTRNSQLKTAFQKIEKTII
ncbi:cellulose biosynthesis protein BcsQ [Paenibacillus sp. 1182]|uniref:AAA family ATPase n=1 Tax=Paenibacillus sp. 1182 TaxID=2806565 RepID=UPI001AE15D42|nr:AAA family ATPase [Paenibacillus sp. 1182]MBP1308762.1 cellulose biosynthesis protein BcsQ [Paenibacillus sp. 1182]